MSETIRTPFELSFPDLEAELVRSEYEKANVILEYGSGGSTVLAGSMCGKRIFSVESDKEWAIRLQAHVDSKDLPSPTTISYVNIGPTGEWGRPIDNTFWTEFYNYPLSIWDEPFFRHPDVVLIDGRFRVACMLATIKRITRPVTVLFDDYRDRRPYQLIEQWIEPKEFVGRMAVFKVSPDLIVPNDIKMTIEALSQVTYASQLAHYHQGVDEAIRLRRSELQGRQNGSKGSNT